MTNATLVNGSSYQATPFLALQLSSSDNCYAKTNDRVASTFVTSIKHDLDHSIAPRPSWYPPSKSTEPSPGMAPGSNASSPRIRDVLPSTAAAAITTNRAHQLESKSQVDVVLNVAAVDEPPQIDSSPLSLPLPPPPPPPQQEQQGTHSETVLIIIVVGVLVFALIVATCCWFACARGINNLFSGTSSAQPRNGRSKASRGRTRDVSQNVVS
ncbi:uncharacterized protein PG986_014865 [Apiospora aurea]|uniref:Uncharacterized protein n=1 Tax=Apiospora aurea TaxID=335848 RepID=A0ABR1PU70_9PEZI